MRCKNCGSRAYPGKYCTGCGMMQPPKLAKGLKRAVACLSVLVCLLTAAVWYVLTVIEPVRREENAEPVYLADLRDAANAANSQGQQSAAGDQQEAIAAQEKQETVLQAEADELPQEQTAAAEEDAANNAEEEIVLEAQAGEAQTVEAQMKEVRADYDAIEAKRQRGEYTQFTLRKSVYVYADGLVPMCIVMRSGADDVEFDRSYYFVDGKLRFAYLEADDAVRMYFKDDELLRLRYAENAYHATQSVDYDGAEDEESAAWCAFVQTEAYAVRDQAVEQLSVRQEYIFPDSDTKRLTEAEVEKLSAWELRIARNEIYARHGRCFDDAALQEYFDGCSWYEGTIRPEKFSERVLSDVESENIRLIQLYEAAQE